MITAVRAHDASVPVALDLDTGSFHLENPKCVHPNLNLSFVLWKKESISVYYSHLFLWIEKYFDNVAIMSLCE